MLLIISIALKKCPILLFDFARTILVPLLSIIFIGVFSFRDMMPQSRGFNLNPYFGKDREKHDFFDYFLMGF